MSLELLIATFIVVVSQAPACCHACRRPDAQLARQRDRVQIFKYVGVAYLLWMAWSTLKERGAPSVENRATDARSSMQVTMQAITQALDLLPRLPAAIPQRGDTAARPHADASGVFVDDGLLAASIRHHVISRPRVLTWKRRTFAAAFVALGAKLAVADR